jgi:AraC-like DNA-binding protein
MEIAFVLGYSEYSSFSQAYKCWKGISLSESRKLEQNPYEEDKFNTETKMVHNSAS